jgi:hypothetical protein
VRTDHEQAVRLAPVGGDLGQELVRSHARGRGQVGFRANLGADGLRHRGGAGQPGPVLADVEIGLVQRQWLDQVGVAGEDFAHLARHGLVTHEVRRHEHRLRTQALGTQRRHGRTHPEPARLVTGRAHHRARPAPGHDHRDGRAGPDRRAARPRRRTHPCRCGRSCAWAGSVGWRIVHAGGWRRASGRDGLRRSRDEPTIAP